MLGKVQVGLSFVLYRPLPDPAKVFTRVRCSHIANHLLLLLAPFPEDGADI